MGRWTSSTLRTGKRYAAWPVRSSEGRYRVSVSDRSAAVSASRRNGARLRQAHGSVKKVRCRHPAEMHEAQSGRLRLRKGLFACVHDLGSILVVRYRLNGSGSPAPATDVIIAASR